MTRNKDSVKFCSAIAGLVILAGMTAASAAQADDPIGKLPEISSGGAYQPEPGTTAAREAREPQASLGADLHTVDGALKVEQVHDGPAAAKGGFRQGDQVVAINGQPMSSTDQVDRMLRQHKPGDRVTVTVRRDGTQKDLKVTLGTQRNFAQEIAEQTDMAAKLLGERAEQVGRRISRFARRVGEAVDDVRSQRAPRVRDPYDRYSYEPEGDDDSVRADETQPQRREQADAEYQGDGLRLRFGQRGYRDDERTQKRYGWSDERTPTRGRASDRPRQSGYWEEDESRNRQAALTDRTPDEQPPRGGALGVTLADDEYGVKVTRVQPGGAAEEAGIRRGDEIKEINGRSMPSQRDVMRYLSRQFPGEEVEVLVERGGWHRTITATLGDQARVLRGSGRQGEYETMRDRPRRDMQEANEDLRRAWRDDRDRAREAMRGEREHADAEREYARQSGYYEDEPTISQQEAQRLRDTRQRLRDNRRDTRQELRDNRRDYLEDPQDAEAYY